MKSSLPPALAILIAGVAFAGSASARYLCDNPPSGADRRACEAADQGPDQLRRYIERMRPFHSMYFPEYVNEERLIGWRLAEARERTLAETAPGAEPAVVKAEAR